MKIPPKISLQGDERKAETLRGFALSQLRILERKMSFRGLEQDSRKLVFEDGTRVSISSVFGSDYISIYVPEVPAEVAPEEAAIEELPRASVFVLGGKHKQGSGRPKVTSCSDVPELVWPVDKNPEELVRGAEAELFVEGGIEQYTWTIEKGEEGEGSRGFWFDVEHTLTEIEVGANSPGFCDGDAGPDQAACEANGGTWRHEGSTVVLYADDTICGAAEITVVDACQNVVSGEVPYEKLMKWYLENPTEILRDDWIKLQVEDGEPPFTWSVEALGSYSVYERKGAIDVGFFLDGGHTLREMETEERYVYLEAGHIVCGGVLVKVADSCETELEVEIALHKKPMEVETDGFAFPCKEELVELRIKEGVEPYTWSTSDFPKFGLKAFGEDPRQQIVLEVDSVLYQHADYCDVCATVTVIDGCEDETTKEICVPPTELVVQWDYDNSDEEIDPFESDVPICVKGGAAPYTWSVSAGYTLTHEETDGPCNWLEADDCNGLATVTVTDCCGKTCTGYIRCTNGLWKTWEKWDIDAACVPGGTPNICETREEVEGDHKWSAFTGLSNCCQLGLSWECDYGEGMPGSDGCTHYPPWSPYDFCIPTGACGAGYPVHQSIEYKIWIPNP